jgi:hypothetical protein
MGSETDPVRITVDISCAEPFRGTIAECDRPSQPFNGWTAFAAAFAAVVRRMGRDEGVDADGIDGENAEAGG